MSDAVRKVWAVVSGEYSDYRVRALFEIEADAHAARVAGLGDDVEEFAYYPAGVAPTKYMVYQASARVGTRADADRDIHINASVEWDADSLPPKRPVVAEYKYGDGVRVVADGLTAEAVTKVVSDRVAKLKAQREGL